ncbi:MAG: ribonuclease M5 [Clostridiales Family XIII bacterium]|jgi:ribonuclease M5|nr:ribonuclease M5 [Clostridiales Family XIII bacterium]
MNEVRIKEIIIVEGKNDENAVRAACAADTIATGGFGLRPDVMRLIEKAYNSRGILILTDPDHAGEKIRARLSKRFPDAKHAWVPRAEAAKRGDVGIENAGPEAILAALGKARVATLAVRREFTEADMIEGGLAGHERSAELRDKVGWRLGIGYGNAKAFLKRLNAYGVGREEFDAALAACRAGS